MKKKKKTFRLIMITFFNNNFQKKKKKKKHPQSILLNAFPHPLLLIFPPEEPTSPIESRSSVTWSHLV